MGYIHSAERTKDKGNTVQEKQTEPVVSIAVDTTTKGTAVNRPAALNVPAAAIANELHKNNVSQLETVYFDERKHLGDVH